MKYLQNDFDNYNMLYKQLDSVFQPLYDKLASRLDFRCDSNIRKQLTIPLYDKLNRPLCYKFGRSQTILYTDLFFLYRQIT